MSVKNRLSGMLPSDGSQRSQPVRLLIYLSYVVVSLAVLVPLYWMVATSLKTTAQIAAFPPHLVPPTPALDAYWAGLSTGPWLQWFINTTIVSLGATVMVLTIATPAAYSLARRSFPGVKPIYVMFIGVLMIPPQILLIPMYVLFTRFGLVDSRLGLMIAYSAFFLGFSVFLLHSFFTNLPSNVEEAARVGGVKEWKIFLKVVLPLAKPGIVTTGIFIFVFTWNEFLFALTFLQSDSLYTISVGLQEFQGLHGQVAYNEMFAMSTLATLPVVVLFVLFSETFIKGMAGLNLK